MCSTGRFKKVREIILNFYYSSNFTYNSPECLDSIDWLIRLWVSISKFCSILISDGFSNSSALCLDWSWVSAVTTAFDIENCENCEQNHENRENSEQNREIRVQQREDCKNRATLQKRMLLGNKRYGKRRKIFVSRVKSVVIVFHIVSILPIA